MSIDRIQVLKDELNVRVFHESVWEDRGAGRQRYELPDVVRHVDLGLSPVQWCSLAMRDPDVGIPPSYVGGCCGNMSYVQDLINGAFRDGGGIDGSDLLSVGKLMRDHDGDDEQNWFRELTDDEFVALVGKYKEAEAAADGVMLDPWLRIGLIFNGVENALTMNLTQPFRPEKFRDDYPDDKKLLSRIESTLRYMSWGDLFANSNRGSDEDFPRETDEQREQRHARERMRAANHDATRVLNFAKLLAPTRRLHELMEARDDVFEGWAIVDPQTREPLTTGVGEAFFASREDAEWLVNLWKRDAANDERRDIPEQNRTVVPAHEIVEVRVTVANGLEVQT